MENKKNVTECFEVLEQCLIIHIHEELDHHRTIALREESDKLIERNNIKYIVFDFEGVDFMDSSGIGMVMGRYKRVIFNGGKVAVSGVSSPVDRIFRLSGIYKIMEKHDTVKAAVEAF